MNPIKVSKGLPILGHGLSYKKDRLAMLKKLVSENGNYFKMRLGPKMITVVNDKDMIKHLMQTNMKNYIKRTNIDRILGDGVLTANGALWKKQRETIRQLFSSKYINDSILDIQKITEQTLQEFETSEFNGTDIRKLFTETTFKIIAKCIIGQDYSSRLDMIDEALFIISDYLTLESYKFLSMPGAIDGKKRAYEKAVKELDELIYSSIEDAKANLSGKSLIHLMLNVEDEVGKPFFNDLLVRDNIVTMIFAGFETSSMALSCVCMELAKSEEHQSKCLQEAVAEVYSEAPDAREIMNSTLYTEACLNESLRLYPPVWAFTRVAVEEDTIAGHPVQKDEIMLISPYLMHRNQDDWKNPEAFDPLRFYGKSIQDRHRFSFLPFGGGPRVCVGMQFAMIEMKIILKCLLSKYKLVPHGEVPQIDARATLYSKNGFKIKLEKRN